MQLSVPRSSLTTLAWRGVSRHLQSRQVCSGSASASALRSRRPFLAAAATAAVIWATGVDCGRCACAAAPERVVPLATRTKTPKAERSKPMVVLIHGLDSWSGTWQELMEELARRGIRTLAVDLRGHGESPLGDPEDFSPEQLAADVRAALKEARWLESPVVLVGHSMGGRIAMQYAAAYPEDLSVLVIEDMDCAPRKYPKLGGAELKRRRQFSREFPSWELAKKQLMSFGYDGDRVDSWWSSDTPRVYPRANGVWSCINPHAQHLAKLTVLNSMKGQESLQRIAAVTQSGLAKFPVHVCVAGPGKFGTVCEWDVPGGLNDMASVHPAMRLHKFPTAGHSIHNTDLQNFADLLEKLLEDN